MSLKVEEFVEVTVSVPIKPDRVKVVVAVSDASYVLLEALIDETVSNFFEI